MIRRLHTFSKLMRRCHTLYTGSNIRNFNSFSLSSSSSSSSPSANSYSSTAAAATTLPFINFPTRFYSTDNSFNNNNGSSNNNNSNSNSNSTNSNNRKRYIVSETNSSTNQVTTFTASSSTSTTTITKTESSTSLLNRIYLPEDYPNSVGVNFAPYCSWLMVQHTVGSAAYVLSTNAMLVSIGVTSAATSLPLAATINWALKDGLGSLGMIAFAAYVGQRFDANAKSTKWFADVLFNVGVLLELMTPLAPTFFLPLASLAYVAKGIGGLAAGASKASLHKTLALRENLGDITAKLYSQGT